jgi:hypothetical protein
MYHYIPAELKNDHDIQSLIITKIIDDINLKRIEKSNHILYDYQKNFQVLEAIYKKYGSYSFDITNGTLVYGDD